MNKKTYQVNWNIYGSVNVKANDEEEAREIVENMTIAQLKDNILKEAQNGFNIGTIEEINCYKPVDEIFTEMKRAIDKHGIDKIELLVSREEGTFYIHYHDKHNSCPIGDTYSISDYSTVDIKQLELLCNENNFDFMEQNTENKCIKEYFSDLNYLLIDRLREECELKVIALADTDITFKNVFEKYEEFKNIFNEKEFKELKDAFLFAFIDATENYWYNKLSELGVTDKQIEEWQNDSAFIEYDINENKEPLIISKFKGIAYTTVYMDLNLEILNNINKLKENLNEGIYRIIKAQELKL